MTTAIQTTLLVVASGAVGAGAALAMARAEGSRRLVGALVGLLALAALTVLGQVGVVTERQALAGSAALVVGVVAVTLVGRRPPA